MNQVTEKSITRNVFPIKKNNPKERYKKNKLVFNASDNSEWDHNCYKLIDFLSTKIMTNILMDDGLWEIEDYQNELFLLDFETLKKDQKTILKKINDSDLYNQIVTVKNTELIDSPQFHGYPSKKIKSIIEKASTCKMKFTHNFLTRVPNYNYNKYSLKTSYFNTILFEDEPHWSLFNVDINNEKKGKDGKYYNRTYDFKFGPLFESSIHSVLFLHNIYTKAYDVIPENFYSLSVAASTFYRLFLLGLYNKKTIQVHINFSDAARLLGLLAKNKSQVKLTIKRILNEILDKKMIKEFKNKRDVFIISL